MTIELNGMPVEVPDGSSLADAVVASGAEPAARGVAAALDGEVVPRQRWGSTALEEGQQVEVVQAVQGG